MNSTSFTPLFGAPRAPLSLRGGALDGVLDLAWVGVHPTMLTPTPGATPRHCRFATGGLPPGAKAAVGVTPTLTARPA
jgi:hypothetical protein